MSTATNVRHKYLEEEKAKISAINEDIKLKEEEISLLYERIDKLKKDRKEIEDDINKIINIMQEKGEL